MARDTYEFESSYVDSCIPFPCIPNYALPVCEHCTRSDHDNDSYAYYVSADGFTKLSSTIKTMSDQQLKLTNFI